MSNGRDTEPGDRRVLTSTSSYECVLASCARIGEPDRRRYRAATMTGVTRHACIFDMVFPIGVDVTSHLQHASRHLIGVFTLIGVILGVVAIRAILLFCRCNPLGHREHHASEFSDRQIGQYLHVLVDILGQRTTSVRWRLDVPHLICRNHLLQQSRIAILLHTGTAITQLFGVDRRTLTATGKYTERDQGRNQSNMHFHWATPEVSAGSGTGSNVVG